MESAGQAWDSIAQQFGTHYAAVSSRKDWQDDEYYETGRREWENSIKPWLPEPAWLGIDLGCGDGRIAFAATPPDSGIGLYCVDSSEEMCLEFGRQAELRGDPLPRRATRISTPEELIQHLATQAGNIDFAYCKSVFIHIPRRIAFGYTQAIQALLRPGGRFIFDYCNLRHKTYVNSLKQTTASIVKGDNPIRLNPGMEYYLPEEWDFVLNEFGWKIIHHAVGERNLVVVEKP